MKSSMVARIVCIILASLLVIPADVAPGSGDVDGHRLVTLQDTARIAVAAGAPDKIGGGLRTLMRLRGQGLARLMPDLSRVLKAMDDLGGAKVGIWFDHKLSVQEKKFLETQFGVKFTIADGRLQDLVPIYSAAIPWNTSSRFHNYRM